MEPRKTEENNCGVFDAKREIEQHAVRAKVGQVFRIEVFDRRKVMIAQQAGPEIIGAHLHAALVGADGERRQFARGLIVAAIVFGSIDF